MPDFVVNVDSINIFKSRLDKYWINQDSLLFLITQLILPELETDLSIELVIRLI